MTVFKAFLSILNKNKFIIIMYTAILLIFGTINMQNSDNTLDFTASKPDIAIVNNDEDSGIAKSLIDYMSENCNLITFDNNEDAINDGLFYREVNYVIYIPENFNNDIMNGLNPEVKIKSTGDYQASLAERLVSRYINVVSIYRESFTNEDVLIDKVNETLSKNASVEITSKIDTNSLSKAVQYFNFESYSILACLIYVICLIIGIFNNDKIRKRNIISSTDYHETNKILLLSNCLFAVIIWLFYLIISFILIGEMMFSKYGLLFGINSLIFTICATTLAFLLGNLIKSKNAISGVVNVVALGSSFLCGAFVPTEFLPSSVLKTAHFLPTYWYINSNELLKNMEVFNIKNLQPIIVNFMVIILFSAIFVILSNIISKKKQKIG